MNKNKIKQIFIEVAKALPEAGFRPPRPPMPPGATSIPITLDTAPFIRGNLILFGKNVRQFYQALEEIAAEVKKDRAWSKSSVDEAFSSCLADVAVASLEERQAVIRQQADELIRELETPPQKWQVDLTVFGMSLDCDGLTFGQISFMALAVPSEVTVPGLLEKDREQAFLCARVMVEAVDRKSAEVRAIDIVDEHLAVLNALCSEGVPSWIRLYRKTVLSRLQSLIRVQEEGLADTNAGFIARSENRASLLTRASCERTLQKRGGNVISGMLRNETDFGLKLISAFATLGRACVEDESHLAFLLYAIALESSVLGGSKTSELTYQLSARVAHLIGSGLEARRQIVERINVLYNIRSGIVHRGNTEIVERDLSEIRNFCLWVLITLATSDNFKDFTKVEQLQNWFKDRMLGLEGESGAAIVASSQKLSS